MKNEEKNMPYSIENDLLSGMFQILQYQSYLVLRKGFKFGSDAFQIFDPIGKVALYSLVTNKVKKNIYLKRKKKD
jgi:hypothetical protein